MNPTLTTSTASNLVPSVLVGGADAPDPHEINALLIVHVFAVLLLIGATFYACAGAPDTRKKTLMCGGMASLLVVVTGVRLWQVLFQFEYHWPFVKLVCWLGISAVAGLAYRRREMAGLWLGFTMALALLAVAMVVLKPF